MDMRKHQPEPAGRRAICRWCGRTIEQRISSGLGIVSWLRVGKAGHALRSEEFCSAYPVTRYRPAGTHEPWPGQPSRPGFTVPDP